MQTAHPGQKTLLDEEQADYDKIQEAVGDEEELSAPADDLEEEKGREFLFKELLLCSQAVGEVKDLKGVEVYFKKDSCEDALRELGMYLKRDSQTRPEAARMLGEWNFLKNELIPLVVFHKSDLKVAFSTLILMVLLTQQPKSECEFKDELQKYLRNYKEAFCSSELVGVLIMHMANCLQAERQNKKHEQMVELIICLFKLVLAI